MLIPIPIPVPIPAYIILIFLIPIPTPEKNGLIPELESRITGHESPAVCWADFLVQQFCSSIGNIVRVLLYWSQILIIIWLG